MSTEDTTPRPEDFPNYWEWRQAVEAHISDGAPSREDYGAFEAYVDARREHRASRDPFADRRSWVRFPESVEVTDEDYERYASNREIERAEWFAEAWFTMDAQRTAAQLGAGDTGPDTAAPLPLPESLGGPGRAFGEVVDAYTAGHRVSRAECFRRIAAITGNSTNGLALRYNDRYGSPWRFAAP